MSGQPMAVSPVIAADGDRRSEQNTRSITRQITARTIPAEEFGITNRRPRGPHRVGRDLASFRADHNINPLIALIYSQL
jgi:hypothetical protein